jgi:hypothetical protein
MSHEGGWQSHGCAMQDFVYAVEMNHRKERLLNGAALESVASRPAMLITGAAMDMDKLLPQKLQMQHRC